MFYTLYEILVVTVAITVLISSILDMFWPKLLSLYEQTLIQAFIKSRPKTSSLSYDSRFRVYINNVYHSCSRSFKDFSQKSINSADLQGQSNVLKTTEDDL